MDWRECGRGDEAAVAQGDAVRCDAVRGEREEMSSSLWFAPVCSVLFCCCVMGGAAAASGLVEEREAAEAEHVRGGTSAGAHHATTDQRKQTTSPLTCYDALLRFCCTANEPVLLPRLCLFPFVPARMLAGESASSRK